MPPTEIRIAGFGGQGVIIPATVIGKAACIDQKGYATMTQFRSRSAWRRVQRAGVISNEPVLYPYVTEPGVMILMSQEAFTRFSPEIKDGGILIVEQDLVRVSGLKSGIRLYSVPATRLAEELGKKMVLNVVMVGFFGAVTGLLDPENLRKAVADSVPPAFQQLNLQAFDKGFEYGVKFIAERGEAEHHPLEAE